MSLRKRSGEESGGRKDENKISKKPTTRKVCLLPDVHGEAAAAGHRVLIGPFQSDAGFGPCADFTAEDHRLPKGAHHI